MGLRGLAGLYGGEKGTMDALLRAVPPALVPQVGVAPGKFPAYLAAAQARPGQILRVEGDPQGFLAGLPVSALPLSWRTRERLVSFGLRTLGDLAALPQGPLQAQFGKEGAQAWSLARGQDERPLVPRRHQEAIRESLAFPAPTVALEAILLALESLLGRAFSCPQLRGRLVRAATLEGRISHAAPWQRRVAFREPVGDKGRALAILRGALACLSLPGPLEGLELTLTGLTGEGGRQGGFFSEVRRREQLGEALRQLEARLGTRPPVYQVRSLEPWSRIPERRRALLPFAP